MKHSLSLSLVLAMLVGDFVLAAPKENPADYPIPSSSYPVPDYTPAPQRARSHDPAEQPFLGGLEFGAQYPVVLGTSGQNFKPGVGLHGAIHLNALGNFRTALYVGYQNLPIRADNTTSFRIVPILAQLGVEARTSVDWIYLSFDLGVGGAMAWLNTVNTNAFQTSGYFAAQIQPGLEFVATDMFSVVVHVPILYLFSTKPMGYLSYDGGVKINL